MRYSQRLADNDIVTSDGSKGDSFDNAMAESFNGLYKWELIYPKGPWRGLDDVEFATLTYVEWFNNRRLHGQTEPGPGFTTPSALEAAYYRQTVSAQQAETQTSESLYETRGASVGASEEAAARRAPARKDVNARRARSSAEKR